MTPGTGCVYQGGLGPDGCPCGSGVMRTISGSWVSIAALFAVSVCAQEAAEDEAAADPAASAQTIELDPNAPPSTRPGCLSIRRVRNFSGLSNELV